MLLAHWLLPLKDRRVSSRRSRRRRTPTVPAIEHLESRVLLCASHGLENNPLSSPATAPPLFAASDIDLQGGRVDADVEIVAPFGVGCTDSDRRPPHDSETRRELITSLRRELPNALRNLQRGNIAPVDLAQAAIGPGMAVFTRYAKVMDTNGSPMTVRSALGLINQTLDEVLTEQEGV